MASDISVNNYNSNEEVDSSEFDDYSNEDAPTYFKNLSLRYFCANPMEMLTNHKKLKKLCLQNGNPEAHYVEGILNYFCTQDRESGLFHLRESSIRNNPNGTFLYGLLMLARESYVSGKRYLDKLNWTDDLSLSDQCWTRIQNSLKYVYIPMTTAYYVAMINLLSLAACDCGENAY